MQIQWCLKGIPESNNFDDAAAVDVLSSGLPTMWVLGNPMAPLKDANAALGDQALEDHVNNYGNVWNTTPYTSLSSGIVMPNSSLGGVHIRPAWRTAIEFATRDGTVSGYIFRLWTIVSSKKAPSLSNVANEVRNLNLFQKFWIFHHEGEIAAPILIPARQISWVRKYDANLSPTKIAPLGTAFAKNRDFIKPDSVSNLLEIIK